MARILVVDDDASARELMRLHLEARGHAVMLASDGAQAMEALSRHETHAESGDSEPVALVISDVEMPVMDGLEFLETLRAGPVEYEMPVIFLTARADEPCLRAAAAAMDAQVIPKPADLRRLFRAMEHALAPGRTVRAGAHASASRPDSSVNPG